MATFQGYWWTPSTDQEPRPGTLIYDPYEGLTLEVSTIQVGGRKDPVPWHLSPEGDEPPVVQGVAHDGTYFTLYDGFVSGGTWGSSPVTVTRMVFNRGLRGAYIDHPSKLCVNKVYARFHGLEPWLSVNHFDVQYQDESPRRITVVRETPEPLRVAIDDGRTVVIARDPGGPKPTSQTELTLHSFHWVGIEYVDTVRVDKALDDLSVVSDLLSLLMGSPTSEYEVWFNSPDVTESSVTKNGVFVLTSWLVGSASMNR